MQRSRELLESTGLKVFLCNSLTGRRVSLLKEFVSSNVKPRFASLGIWILVAGLPNIGKSSLINALKQHSFSDHWHNRRGVDRLGLKPTRAKVKGDPGSTKMIDFFHVSQDPKIYCFDTPGIMLPKMDDPEINLKLAAIGCLDDTVAGLDYVADYILYRLNKEQSYNYVQTLNLKQPTNDIAEVVDHISSEIEIKWNTVGPDQCYKIFINQFRYGHFGKFCLDDLSDIIKLGDLSDFELSEPPDEHTTHYKVIHGL